MRLTELEPQFVKLDFRTETWTIRKEDGTSAEKTGPREYHVFVDKPSDADGIWFLCPKCFSERGKIGCHSVICWSPKVPGNIEPSPGRWNLVGTGYNDLSLIANPTSVKLEGGCNAHFTVSNGQVGFN